MIGAHVNHRGEFQMRRDESPLRRQNPSGEVRWVARYTAKDGRRRSAGTFEKKGPCRTPRGGCCAAHAIREAYEAEAAGTASHQQRGTVGDYAKRWLSLHPRSERSNDTHETRLRAVLPLDLGDGPLDGMLFSGLERRHGVQLVDTLLRSGRAVNGVKGCVTTLSAMWNDAVDDGWTKTANPFVRLRIRHDDVRVQREAREHVLMSWETMRSLAAAGGPHEPFLALLAGCGLRLGEAFPLHREDIKLGAACDEAGCAIVGAHLHVRRKAWRRREYAGAKGPRGERIRHRVAPIPDWLVPKLAPVVMACSPGGYVFTAPAGGMWLEPDWRRSVWYLARARAGMENVVPHDLRHSWVSLHRAAGVDPADLAEMAGHSLETATRTYTHAVGRSFDQVRAAG